SMEACADGNGLSLLEGVGTRLHPTPKLFADPPKTLSTSGLRPSAGFSKNDARRPDRMPLSMPREIMVNPIPFESRALADVLLAEGPAVDRSQPLMLYGQFVGSWDGTVVVHEAGGRRESSCEVHFGWVLAGRAVQDVWIAPSRHARGPAEQD